MRELLPSPKGTIMADKLPQGYAVSTLDTEGTPAPVRGAATSNNSTIQDTAGAMGGVDKRESKPLAADQVDTSGTNGTKPHDSFRPVDTSYLGTWDTTLPSVGGTPTVDNPYKAPSVTGAPASVKDTSKTEFIPSNQRVEQAPKSYDISNMDTQNIGAANGHGPRDVSKDTLPTASISKVEGRPGDVLVTIQVSGEQKNAMGYIVEGSTGGHTFVPRSDSATITAIVGDVVPGDRYSFRVASYNAAKTSAFSEWSASVVPTLA